MAISPRTTSYFIPPQGAPQSDDPSFSEIAFAMEVDEPRVGVSQLPATDAYSSNSQFHDGWGPVNIFPDTNGALLGHLTSTNRSDS